MSNDYCFTCWDVPIPDTDRCRYYIFGRERCPSTNREHYQGFIILNRGARIPAAKRILGGGNNAHLEARRGTRVQAREYCLKDGDVTEWGEFEPLTCKDLFTKDIKFLKEYYPAFFCRYHKGLGLLQGQGDKWRDVNVIILWGPTGVGKTRRVMEMDDVYKLDFPYTWWDGYSGESILLIDDYKGGAISRGALLNICDGYKLRLETKGSHTWAMWHTVYITSNYDPALWTTSALDRRVSCVEAVG